MYLVGTTGFQSDDVSVCCEVNVGLMQGCEWHVW